MSAPVTPPARTAETEPAPAAAPPLRLAAKLALAARACGYVQKDGANQFHRYRYASAAAILGHVNEALCEHGLAVVDTLPEILATEGTGKERVVTARMTVTVADTESDERVIFRGLGSGMDSGEKAVMKAVTAALKYAWMGAFSISTGDDPEADEATDRRAEGQGQPQGQRRPQAPSRPTREASQPSRPAQATEASGDAAAAEMPAQLKDFYARLEQIELPGEAVAVWIKHRANLAQLSASERESAWKALCRRTEKVGKMGSNGAKVWLKKSIAEEDARRSLAAEGAQS